MDGSSSSSSSTIPRPLDVLLHRRTRRDKRPRVRTLVFPRHSGATFSRVIPRHEQTPPSGRVTRECRRRLSEDCMEGIVDTLPSSVYLLNSTTREPANPSGLQNLQHLYGLDNLAASVARTDSQGNKIAANKLNKTYKKQILDLGVPGGTDIPKNKFYMDALLGGLAHEAWDGGYRPFTDAEMEEGFGLRPGELHGYIRHRAPSPVPKRGKGETHTPIGTPLSASLAAGDVSLREEARRTSRGHSESRVTRASYVPTPSPPTTRSTAYVPPPPPSDDGNESSDDGSRFKQLERERKKKLRMKREAEMAMGGDHKRRRYDIDGYEFLDSD